MDLPAIEIGTAQAVVGLSVVQVMTLWRDTAPKLSEVRDCPPGDWRMRQALMDADIFGGIAVVMIGGVATLLTRQLFPLLLAASGLLMISLYYRMVLNSADPGTVLGSNKEGANDAE